MDNFKVVIKCAFNERIKELYEKKKDLENPPSYLKIMEEYLEVQVELNELEKNEKIGIPRVCDSEEYPNES